MASREFYEETPPVYEPVSTPFLPIYIPPPTYVPPAPTPTTTTEPKSAPTPILVPTIITPSQAPSPAVVPDQPIVVTPLPVATSMPSTAPAPLPPSLTKSPAPSVIPANAPALPSDPIERAIAHNAREQTLTPHNPPPSMPASTVMTLVQPAKGSIEDLVFPDLTPWYKKPTTWVAAGGALAIGLGIFFAARR